MGEPSSFLAEAKSDSNEEQSFVASASFMQLADRHQFSKMFVSLFKLCTCRSSLDLLPPPSKLAPAFTNAWLSPKSAVKCGPESMSSSNVKASFLCNMSKVARVDFNKSIVGPAMRAVTTIISMAMSSETVAMMPMATFPRVGIRWLWLRTLTSGVAEFIDDDTDWSKTFILRLLYDDKPFSMSTSYEGGISEVLCFKLGMVNDKMGRSMSFFAAPDVFSCNHSSV
mmetsp:Transcript_4616/g.12072  ORF Transcript_4616/g.12072 Transcript_4616/m.12072 type:complete len:226 (-) Transcript_4616:368-1045(-)